MKSVVHGLILSIIVTGVALWGTDLEWASLDWTSFDWTSVAGLDLGVSLFDRDDHWLGCTLLPSAADIELHRACTRWP